MNGFDSRKDDFGVDDDKPDFEIRVGWYQHEFHFLPSIKFEQWEYQKGVVLSWANHCIRIGYFK